MITLLLMITVVTSIILMVATIKYPAVSLVFLLMAGTVKGLLIRQFRFVGVLDPVVLGGIWVMLAMMYNFARTGTRLREVISMPVVIYLLLAALLLLGLVYTSAPQYGFEKSIRFTTIALMAFIAPVVLGRTLNDLKLIMYMLLFMGILYAIGTIIAPQASVARVTGQSRAAFLEVGPLRTAGMIAMGVIIAFCFAIVPHTPARLKTVSILLLPLMLVGVLTTGSRGPLFGLWLCMLTILIIYRKHVSKIWAVSVIGAGVVAFGLIFMQLSYEKRIRIGAVITDKNTTERVLAVRTEMFEWAWENARRHPIIGHGTGAYAVDRNGVDIMDYPHNIILELLYEQGVVGVLLLGLFLWLIFRRWRQAANLSYFCEPSIQVQASHLIHMVGLLFLFNLLQAMKSFDINGNRLVFFSAGLILAAFSWIRQMAAEAYVEDELVTGDWQQSEAGGFHDTQVSY